MMSYGRLTALQRQYKSKNVRLAAYSNKPVTGIPSIRLAEAGFIPTDNHDEVMCPWCSLTLTNLHPKCQPLAWHKVFAKDICPFMINNSENNETDTVIPLLSGDSGSAAGDDPGTSTQDMEGPISTTVTLRQGIDSLENNDDESQTDRYIKDYKLYSKPRYVTPVRDRERILPQPSTQKDANSFTYEVNRMATFKGRWKWSEKVSARQLAKNGFRYVGPEDTVECVYCKKLLSDWERGVSVAKRHVQASPECHFARGDQRSKNVPDLVSELFEDDMTSDALFSTLGIERESAAHPHFAVASRRMDTFLTWPVGLNKQPEEFYECGVFYTGDRDTVCCYMCGVEMRDWMQDEDVFSRHARQSSRCQYLLRERGEQFIDSTLNELGRYVQPNRRTALNTVTTRMVRPRLDGEIAQAVIEMGYPAQDVRAAIIDQLKHGEPDFTTVPSLVEAILEARNNPATRNRSFQSDIHVPTIVKMATRAAVELPEENQTEQMETETNTGESAATSRASAASVIEQAKTIRQQLNCKICMDAPINIVFLPCGHMVCCATCASAMSDCPMCRLQISGRVMAETRVLTAHYKTSPNYHSASRSNA